MEERELDLVFIMDVTGSMGPYIDQAKQNVVAIIDEIITHGESRNPKVGLVQYRDHPPEDTTFVTKVTKLTTGGELKKVLSECSANGGGDRPEAMADALHEATELNWREGSAKVAVLIADAPPHGLIDSGDSFPNGCLNGHDPIQLSRLMAELEITLYVAGVEPSVNDFKEFLEMIAFNTGGRYLPMSAAKLLPKLIVGAALEQMTMEAWQKQVEEEVANQRAQGGDIGSEDFYSGVKLKLAAKGAKSVKQNINKSALPRISKEVRETSDATSNMAEAKTNLILLNSTSERRGFGARGDIDELCERSDTLECASVNLSSRPKSKGGLFGLFGGGGSSIKKKSAPRSAGMARSTTAASGSSMATDEYSYEENADFDEEQIERMVQKAKLRNKMTSD